MIDQAYVVDVFEDIVSKVSAKLLPSLQAVSANITGVHYLYGHYNEVRDVLKEKGANKTRKFDRYPLVVLFQDFPVRKRGNESIYGTATLQMLILAHTDDKARSEQRYTKVFKPILYPIYNELLRQIAKDGRLAVDSAKRINHTQIDRPNWGDPELYGPKGRIFSDVLDGIELKDLEIPIYHSNNC